MSFAPPVIKDRFVFNGDLYVQVESLNRHKRASIAELTTLLRPAQKPSKSALSAAPTDQVGHWYEAQLLHYGLPPSKSKAVAKVRLLDALNAGKLSIPPEIVRLENEMKKEYQAADRKARAAHKAQLAAEMKAVAKGKEVGAGKKRKQPEETPAGMNFNIQFNIGAHGQAMQMVGLPGGEAGQQLAKKAKKSAKVDGKDEKPKSERKKLTANPIPKQAAAKKTAVKKTSVAGSAAQGSPSAPDKPLKKQTAKRSLGPPGNGKMDLDVMRELALKGELAVKKEPAKTKKESAVKREIKDEGRTKQTPTIKQESTIALNSSPMTHPTAIKKESQVKVKKEPKVKNEPGTSPAIKKESAKSPAVKQEKVKAEPTVKQQKVKQEKSKQPKVKTEPTAKIKREPAPSPATKKAPAKRPTTKSEPDPSPPHCPQDLYDDTSDSDFDSDDSMHYPNSEDHYNPPNAPPGLLGPYYELGYDEDPPGDWESWEGY